VERHNTIKKERLKFYATDIGTDNDNDNDDTDNDEAALKILNKGK